MNITLLFDVFLHLDRYLNVIISDYQIWTYAILFIIIFLETGLVVTPFLPGDSMIFAVGAICAAGSILRAPLLLPLLCLAAVAGDTANYHIGHHLRGRVQDRNLRFIKWEYIERTQAFFQRHGGKTITIARFVPIIRTFAPFVAGVSEMPYRRFLAFNLAGGVAWVSLMFGIGYFFGNIPYVKDHFGLIVIAIIAVSVIPAAIALIQNRMHRAAPEL